MHRTYPLAVPIETNHGRGETRRMGPTHLTFATSALFSNGETLRFAVALRGDGTQAINVVGSGKVELIVTEGDLFIIDASIEQTLITFARDEKEPTPPKES